MATGVQIEFTPEELQAVKYWLSVIQFQGTREQVRKPLQVYDAVVLKVENALAEHVQHGAPNPTALGRTSIEKGDDDE